MHWEIFYGTTKASHMTPVNNNKLSNEQVERDLVIFHSTVNSLNTLSIWVIIASQ